MAGAFESVTRVAIEELIQAHAQPSKFGHVLTPEGFQELTNDLYELLVTSRSLKSAGDRFLHGQVGGSAAANNSDRGGRSMFKRPLR